MRSNLPVTQQEFQFSPEYSLVSVTDLKGRITYCNDAFVAVSGYTRDELLGQPHNIVRHPDMPEEAFRDMWHTLQTGQPWTGLVKNRRKNGEHYWVLANATPMKDGDRVTGYLSVRIQPGRSAVQAAQTLYQAMRTQEQAGKLQTVLAQGQVLHQQPWRRLARALTPALRGKLWLLQLATIGLAMLAASCLPPAISWVPGLALALASVAIITALAIQPLKQIIDDANCLAAGDLSHTVHTGQSGMIGNIQRALNQLAVNLRTVVGDTRHEIVEVRQAVAEISAGNLDLSSRTEAQAASLEQTSSSMKEINSAIMQTAASAKHGTNLADATSMIAKRSHQAVLKVGQSMEAINDSSRRIGEIIHVVESVAFQTNILALNAAVEAARAGEAGRGFAVVAAEVRALAQRTTAAAREIKQLVTESAERVAIGNTHSAQAQSNMSEALESVQNVNNLLGDISTGADEQQSGIGQISQAIDHIDGITQQNAAMVEQLASNAQSLLHQMEAVENSMRLFRLKKGEPSIAEVNAVALRKAGKA
jgi:aerotaxis receptor